MRMIIRLQCLVAVALFALLAAPSALAASATPDGSNLGNDPAMVIDPGYGGDINSGDLAEILVKFTTGTSASAIDELLSRNGDTQVDAIPHLGTRVIRVPDGQAAGRLASYASSPLVEYAEPNSPISVLAFPADLPDDPYLGVQWDLDRIGATEAWAVTRGSSKVVVAILDTGIDQDHPDLSSKIVANRNFSTSGTLDDIDGHGTKVAGVAAAITNNGVGVAAVGCDSSLMNAKVMGDSGSGSVAAAVNGILWATNGPDGNPRTDDGADVINMSFVTGVPSRSLQEAVSYAWEHGVVLVGGAGNYGSTDPCYPARYPQCIGVAASKLSSDNALLYYSTHGEWVEVAAPGTSIWTTEKGGVYGRGFGTSIASPHVAGLAALLVATVADSNGNGATNDEVKYAIESTCTDTHLDVRYGCINAYDAVTAAIPSLGFVTGSVTDAVTGEPAYGTYAAAISDGTREAFNDASGGYTIYGVPAGTYQVTASALGYVSQSKTVTVFAGRYSTASFRLTRSSTGSIAGVVRNSSFSRVAGATVTDGTRSATTAADGSYVMSGVPEGHYTVCASAPGYLPTNMAVIVYRGETTIKNFLLFPGSSDGVPEANFSATPLEGKAPLTVVFTDLSVSDDGISSWFWSFGDGASSTQRNPTHTYSKAGSYTVSLTVRDPDGDSHTKTRASYIVVSDTSAEADFSAAPVSGDEPLKVSFTDLSTSGDSISSWLWDFGDGVTSSEQNPAHTYIQDGLYTVSLTITGVDGSSHTKIKANCITVRDTSPEADFAAVPSSHEPLAVAFTDLSASYDGIASWVWDFGDGMTSTNQNPQHAYSRSGTYDVTLEVVDQDGSRSAASGSVQVGSSGITVTVTEAGEPLEGYRVYAYTSEGAYAGSKVTDASGQAVFELAQGDYKFRVYYGGTYCWSPVVSSPGTATISISAEMVVTVTVAGEPLGGYRVYAYTSEGAYAGSKVTDASGQAMFDLAQGSYKFRVYYDGDYWWSPVITAPTTTAINIGVDVDADTVVRVTVGGAPLEGRRVYAFTGAGAYAGMSAVTDTSGEAVFAITEGSYKFAVYYDGAFRWSTVITAPATAAIDLP
jgi:thermitase